MPFQVEAGAFYEGGYAIVVGTPYTQPFRAIFVGGTGNITVTMNSGASLTFSNVPVGMLNVSGTQVSAATATNMVGLY